MAGLVSSDSIVPGGTGRIEVSFNAAGKTGTVIKGITISSNDPETPNVFVPITAGVEAADAPSEPGELEAVLFGEGCTSCHADPAAGLEGETLYQAVCAMCHGPGSATPLDLPLAADEGDIRAWIADGTLEDAPSAGMPGFSDAAGGPLSTAQIESLVAYMAGR